MILVGVGIKCALCDANIYMMKFFITNVLILLSLVSHAQNHGIFDEDVKIVKLDSSINSPYKEINPVYSEKNDWLFFGRKAHPENAGGSTDMEDVWFASFDSYGRSEVSNQLGNINNIGPNLVCSFREVNNSSILLLGNAYKGSGKMISGLSYTFFMYDGWSDPINLKIKDFYNISNKIDATISSSGNILIMSIERADSHGGRDLYLSRKMENDKWSAPINLGNINTSLEESSPYLSNDGKTLFFATNGRNGFGGMDIYACHRLDESWTNWTEPENLGAPVNTDKDEAYFSINSSTTKAFFTRGSGEEVDIFGAFFSKDHTASIQQK